MISIRTSRFTLPGRIFILSAFVSAWLPPVANLGGLNLRLSQVLLPFFVVWIITRQHGVIKPQPPYLLQMLVMVVAYYFWTLVNSTNLVRDMGQVVLLMSNILHYAVAYILITPDERAVKKCLRWIGVCTVLMMSVTLFLTVAARLGWSFAQDMIFMEGLPSYQGGEIVTAWIPRLGNGFVIGSFSSMLLLIFLALARYGEKSDRALFILAALASAIGLVITVSRAAILAFVVGLSLFLVTTWRGHILAHLRLGVIAAACLAAALFLLSLVPEGNAIIASFTGRSLQLVDPAAYSYGTAQGRIDAWSVMIKDIEENPFVGQGALAYRRNRPEGDLAASENFPLEMFHSAGLFGFLGYLWLHLALFWSGLRVVLRRSTNESRWRVLALLSGMMALIVASAFNPFAWSPLYWVLLAVVAAAARAARLNQVAQLSTEATARCAS